MTPRDRGLTVPEVDDVFELLADWRRRAVCRYFVTTGSNAAHLETLVAAVARRSNADVDAGEACEDAIQKTLVEDHLPRLDEAGLLDYDARSDSVRYWGHPTVEKWAEHADAVTDRNGDR